ncbi:MAG: hypothetical protein HKN48_11675 [Flavobacteriaceae bacterium]|nr:hypothetical protein [Flavobacteriaceae bacterium]
MFFLCLSCTLGYGQQKRLVGKIENIKDVEGIHILNTSSRFNSITNASGEFFITASPLDTLVFSSIAYIPEQVVVSKEIYDSGFLSVTLQELVNELDEVYIGPALTGDLERDLKRIKVEDQINFDDVGIPGFLGTPEEKIPNMIGQVITPFSVNIEGLYKHLSGYYKKLRLQRKWQAENVAVSMIIHNYGSEFYEEAFEIPKERVFDFTLFCVETTEIENHFKKESYALVLSILEEKAKVYKERLDEKEE